MKKIIDYTTWAFIAAVIAMMAQRFEVGGEVVGFLKSIAHKLVPWVNAAVYS
ncbi:MAG: hypothetical protein U0U70_08925 [Chitinophagaceae bacterium]